MTLDENKSATLVRRCASAGVVALLLLAGPVAWGRDSGTSTAAPNPPTYFNDGGTVGADPFVHYDRRSGYYYAYSTDGAPRGFHFAIYRSPDLATWERLPGGALPADDPNQWAHDWFWAPEVYHNEKTGVYFLFYSGRMNKNVAHHFQYANFEEPCKVGVATARSPAGPFRNIAPVPLDYFPYDPDYHDINLFMDAGQKKPPATQREGQQAPRGTYIPFIDPNVFFDDDGRTYLYFSRNAYRNWVWDDELGRYIEESNIYVVEIDSAWWHDPQGATMPRIAPRYFNANRAVGDPPAVRKDGYTPILNYGSDKQAWENAHVDDYATSGGRKKNRRWAEGSTTLKVYSKAGKPVYLLTYSGNNYANQHYGVGFATGASPLGPWRKSATNPVLAQDPAKRLFSTGHGSVVQSPDGRQWFYVHHGRPSIRENRRLYTQSMRIDSNETPAIAIVASADDQPLPSGVAPLRIVASPAQLALRPDQSDAVEIKVTSAIDAAFDLTNPRNRLRAELLPDSAGNVTVAGKRVEVTTAGTSAMRLRVYYQRQLTDGRYVDVANPDGTPVSLVIPITVNP